jgi:hypothetical protein
MMDSLSKTKRFAWPPVILASLLGVLMAGCGETTPTGTVRGKVTLDDAPYADAAVVFMSLESGKAGSADIQADGTFSIETPLEVGSYKVFLTPKSASLEEEMDMDKPMPEPMIDESVPEKYWNEASSDITIEITAGENDVTVPLSK